jgi:hypothetical protein
MAVSLLLRLLLSLLAAGVTHARFFVEVEEKRAPPVAAWKLSLGVGDIRSQIAVITAPRGACNGVSPCLVANTGVAVVAINPASGAVVWNATAGIPPAWPNPENPYTALRHGMATPVFEPHTGSLIVALASKHGAVIALDPHDGRLRWTFNASTTPDINHLTIASTPTLLASGVAADVPVVVTTLNGVTLALRADTGVELWRLDGNVRKNSSTACHVVLPVQARNGSVYCCSASDGRLLSLEGATGRWQWSASVLDTGCAFPGPMLGLDGAVLVATVGGSYIPSSFTPHMLSFDGATGAQRWNRSLEAPSDYHFHLASIGSAALSHDGKIAAAVQLLSTPAKTVDARTGACLGNGTETGIQRTGGSPYRLDFSGPLTFHPTRSSLVFANLHAPKGPGSTHMALYRIVGGRWPWTRLWQMPLPSPVDARSLPAFVLGSSSASGDARNGTILMVVSDVNANVFAWHVEAYNNVVT